MLECYDRSDKTIAWRTTGLFQNRRLTYYELLSEGTQEGSTVWHFIDDTNI